jgi:hypothetical protein
VERGPCADGKPADPSVEARDDLQRATPASPMFQPHHQPFNYFSALRAGDGGPRGDT